MSGRYNLRPRHSPVVHPHVPAARDNVKTTTRKSRDRTRAPSKASTKENVTNTTARKSCDPTRTRLKASAKENATDGRPAPSKSSRKREKSIALEERPYKRQRSYATLQTKVQELSIEVKDLRSQNERLRYRWQCHRERSQGDMKDIQGTIMETKDVMTGAVTSVETVLNGLGAPKAVREDGRAEHIDEHHEDSVQPQLCVSHSSICAYHTCLCGQL
jgi:chromosome segregation ATPase